MGELVNLEKYKKVKQDCEDNEIKSLQAELNQLIQDMGGIKHEPFSTFPDADYSPLNSLYILSNPNMWSGFEYLAQDARDEK